MLLVVNNTGVEDVCQTRAAKQLLRILDRHDVAYEVIDGCDNLERFDQCASIQGIILTGSDLRLTEEVPKRVVDVTGYLLERCTVPVLGICFGHQLLALLGGGVVSRLASPRNGPTFVGMSGRSRLSLVESGVYEQMHNDYVEVAPTGWNVVSSSGGVIDVMEHRRLPWCGVQFHPELSGLYGERLLQRFVLKCRRDHGTAAPDAGPPYDDAGPYDDADAVWAMDPTAWRYCTNPTPR
jgi:GMP synthase (glutamine-hydrolysing)